MAKFLVIRLSALGDVAMTIPIVYSAARCNPDDSFTILTQSFLMPVFINRPSNVDVVGIDILGSEKKLVGLMRFVSVLLEEHFDAVLDLHDVIRTKCIRSMFMLRGKKIFVIDKGRAEKLALTRKKKKYFKQLKPITERYSDVFRRAGLKYEEHFQTLYDEKPADLSRVEKELGEKTGRWIGVAPFAKHEGKIYPLRDMETVVSRLAKLPDTKVFLFGGKGEEEQILQGWVRVRQNVVSVAGRFSLDNELSLMSMLDLMVCMDSANMHFASLVGTRVISIWGATHPFAGFYGFHQNPEDAIQEHLACRPCSVYGQVPCYRKDYACMRRITPDRVMAKITSICKVPS